VAWGVCGEMGERHRHKKVKNLNENILDLRVGLDPTTSTILVPFMHEQCVFLCGANGGKALAQES
jgi:hypothetical protein